MRPWCRWIVFCTFLVSPWAAAAWAAPGPIQGLIEAATGKPASLDALLAAMRAADIVILGEVHENPEHHRLRGELLAALAHPKLSVLAEHLDAGVRVDFSAGLLPGLSKAGFNAKAWQWPMHQPLFESIARSGLPLWGANLPDKMTSSVHASGLSVLPQPIGQMLARAPLSGPAKQKLEEELFDGHCRMLPREMLPRMMDVQRARDAYMAHELLARLPAVLVAGNGHAWRDVGVPQLITAHAPQAKLVIVMFVEGPPKDLAAADYFWVTPEVVRPDPCAAFRRPKGDSQAPQARDGKIKN